MKSSRLTKSLPIASVALTLCEFTGCDKNNEKQGRIVRVGY